MPARTARRVVAAIIERDGEPLAGRRGASGAEGLLPCDRQHGQPRVTGEILICQRRRDDSHALKWEFPGGKVEPGESPQEALERELEEELAIQAKIGPQLACSTHQYPGRAPMELIFFSVREFHGVPVNRAFEQIRWETPARLPEYDFLEADAAILRALATGS